MKCHVYDLEAYRKALNPEPKNEVETLIAEKLEYERRSMVYDAIRDHEEMIDYI